MPPWWLGTLASKYPGGQACPPGYWRRLSWPVAEQHDGAAVGKIGIGVAQSIRGGNERVIHGTERCASDRPRPSLQTPEVAGERLRDLHAVTEAHYHGSVGLGLQHVAQKSKGLGLGAC